MLKLVLEVIDLVVLIYFGLYNVGIGVGVLFGNYIVGDFGLLWIGIFGGVVVIFVVGIVWVVLWLYVKWEVVVVVFVF